MEYRSYEKNFNFGYETAKFTSISAAQILHCHIKNLSFRLLARGLLTVDSSCTKSPSLRVNPLILPPNNAGPCGSAPNRGGQHINKGRTVIKKVYRRGENAMQANEVQQSRVRRTVNDLVMAEMLLVQATIESATAIGDGLNELGRQISEGDESEISPWDTVSSLLQRTVDEAMEPYTSRFKYLRDIISRDS